VTQVSERKLRGWRAILAASALLGSIAGVVSLGSRETVTINRHEGPHEPHAARNSESRDHLSAELDSATTRFPAGIGPWQLLSHPVIVTVQHADASFSLSDLPPLYLIELRDLKKTVRLETALTGVSELKSALESLRQAVAWTPPYLFVQLGCGGGNAWLCDRVIVFKVDDGIATHLVSVAAQDGPPDDVFTGHYFIDTYDKLEQDYGFGHAEAPWFSIAIEDTAQGLVVSAEATWLLNHDRYRSHSVFTQAVLAKYCGKQRELQRVVESALPTLESADTTLLFETLDAIVPSELPSAWR